MKYWKAQEYRLRDFFRKNGWISHRIPCSGSASLEKGDVLAEKNGIKLRIDHKSTRGKSQITIKREDLEKIIDQRKEGEYSILSFSFYEARDIYVILSLKDLIKILEI